MTAAAISFAFSVLADCRARLAAKRMRFGYQSLTALLAREGMSVNHKRVYRMYREERWRCGSGNGVVCGGAAA